MKINRSVLVVFISSLCWIQIGCGPIYETQYTYSPPVDERGRTCIFQCENSKLFCEQLVDSQTENCRQREAMEYDRCKRRKEKYCSEGYCSSDYERCERQYRMCYQACGGKISEQRVCVGFCEQK